MSKKIDKLDASKRLLIARLGLSIAVERVYDELKEDQDGPEVSLSAMIALAEDLFDNNLMPGLKALVNGDLPDVTEDDLEPEPEPEPEPGQNVITIMNTGAKMSWNSYYYDKFVFPKCGPEYTNQPFYILYENGDRLDVPDPEHMVMIPSNNKYQPGGRWSNNNPDIPTMEVYARKDQHPAWVKAIFRHNV